MSRNVVEVRMGSVLSILYFWCIVLLLNNEREVTFEEGKALADKFNNEYIETSYKTWYNCTEAFVLITKKIIEYKAAERRKKNNKCFVLCQFEY